MIRIHPTELQRMHDELLQAIRTQADWHRRVTRTLVCRLPPDPQDLQEDAQDHCSFGGWFHAQEQGMLRDRPAYVAIAAEHARVHQLAARVLREMAASGKVPNDGFDAFVASSAQLRFELDSLRNEMVAALRSRDALTGAYGRNEILPALREARELARRHVQPACIAFMDLDHFKVVNDTHGHGVGDEVLACAAHRVEAHLRSYDKVFRYGGDEFLLLLPGTHLDEAQRLVDRIRVGLSDHSLVTTVPGEPVYVAGSFGVTPLDPDLTVEESIGRADKALLLAKASGRNRVVCWDPATTTGVMLERELKSLRVAGG